MIFIWSYDLTHYLNIKRKQKRHMRPIAILSNIPLAWAGGYSLFN